MRLLSTAAVPLLLAASASARFVIYADEWHPTRPTSPADRAGIDHVVIAFAMANNTAAFQPKVPVSTLRSEFPKAKIMIAIGGWGDTVGFTEATKSEAGIDKFAADVKTMITTTGVDGVDIDWEYPGGNGADYKQVPNSAKVHEIAGFPKLLAATRAAIGKDKLLSIAVPGKKVDMIAFTKQNGKLIWPSVDYINVMAYDLMNRRDTVTAHHTSVQGATTAIKNYLAIGAPASKINLGFAYYAKYFTTKGHCESALGCPIVEAEDPLTGKDALTSGAWTFEKSHLTPVDASALAVSYDGTCGAEKGTKCASGCCSQYGNCGTSPEHCSGACQHAFGTGCTDADVAGSWELAAQSGQADEAAGGQYFYDAINSLFWTWDSPEFVTRKFRDIVGKYGIGGVMAWSLGEDSYDWSHIKQMAKELQARGGYVADADVDVDVDADAATDVVDAVKPDVSPSPTPYDVVYVDGAGGPEADADVNATAALDSSVDSAETADLPVDVVSAGEKGATAPEKQLTVEPEENDEEEDDGSDEWEWYDDSSSW